MSVDVPVALLGYGTVGSAVARLLAESADDIERATGHRLRRRPRARTRRRQGARAPAAPTACSRPSSPTSATTPSIARRRRGDGRPRADRRLRARAASRRQAGRSPRTSSSSRGAARSSSRRRPQAGVQLRFEASVCAAIPVIKVLREALVDHERPPRPRDRERDDELHPHADGGRRRPTPTRSPRRSSRATPRPIRPRTSPAPTPRRRWRSSRPSRSGRASTLDDVDYRGIEGITPDARRGSACDSTRSCGSSARRRSSTGASTSAFAPSLVDRHHPLAAVEGAFNAVMLQGDAIREITLAGPGAGGIETASAVIADMVSVVGTTGTGFLQNDACWRTLERCRPASCGRRSTSTSRSTTVRACSPTSPSGWPRTSVSVARLVQQQINGTAGAAHRHARGALGRGRRRACGDRRACRRLRGIRPCLPVISERGVPGLGWI